MFDNHVYRYHLLNNEATIRDSAEHLMLRGV